MGGGFKDKRFRHKAQRDRRVAGFDEIANRNAKKSDDEEEKKEGKEGDDEESSEEDSDSEQEVDEKGIPKGPYKKEKSGGLASLIQRIGLNDEEEVKDPSAPVELTRREREEIEAERKKRHFEKLQAEGKTDEAKADLERLAKIRAEREAAKKAREDEVAKKKGATSSVKANAEYVAAMRGDEDGNRMRGDRSKENKKSKKDKRGDKSPEKDEKKHSQEEVEELKAKSLEERKALDKETYAAFGIGQDAVEVDKDSAVKGTIEACRAEEDDFM